MNKLASAQPKPTACWLALRRRHIYPSEETSSILAISVVPLQPIP
jgi:hypothetical protein